MYMWTMRSICSIAGSHDELLPRVAILLPERSIQTRGLYGLPVRIASSTADG